MRVLILTTYPIDRYVFDKSRCETRSQLFAYNIYKYLIQKDVEVEIEQCFPTIKSSHMRNKLLRKTFPKVDHVLLVEEKGFYFRPDRYVDKLRTTTNGLIAELSIIPKYISRDVVKFCLGPKYNSLKCSKYLGITLDEFALFPVDNIDTINLLVDKNVDNESIYAQLKNFADNNKKDIVVNIYRWTYEDYEKYNNQTTDIEVVDVESILDHYNVYSKIDMYFLNHKVDDEYKLYELGMANVMIVSPKEYIRQHLVDILDPVVYTSSKIPWKDVFLKYNGFNIRDTLLEKEMVWSKSVDEIYEYMVDYVPPIRKKNINLNLDLSINQKPTENKPKSTQRSNQRSDKLNKISKNHLDKFKKLGFEDEDDQEEVVVVKKKQPKILLQSNIKKMIKHS